MAIVISGVNNNDKITASDGTIDLLSGVSYAGIITAPAFTTPGNFTAGHLNIGSGIQLGNAGVATATTFVGNLTGNVNATSNLLLQIGGSEKFRVGSSGQLGIAGANYGTSGQVLSSGGSGSAATWQTIDLSNLNASNLTSGTVPTARLGSGTASSSTFLRGDSTFAAVPSTNIVNNASGRLVVGSNTANTLDAKSEATYNGTKLFLSGGVGQDQHIPMLELKHLNTAYSSGNGDGPAILLNGYYASNEWALAKIAAVNAGGQYGSGYGGGLQFWVHPANGTQTASVIKGAEIIGDGTGANLTINDGNLVIGTGGHGIDFSADGSGTLKTLPNSFNAELLHDYENGTFTPNIQYDTGTNRYAGSNVSSAVGEYIRIGDLVSFGMKITLTGNRNYSEITHIYIGGLPYNGMHSSFQSSMMNGWGGWACPTNDNNFSYDVRYCFHGYTTVNLGFSQSSGNGGISGFYVWGFYRTAP